MGFLAAGLALSGLIHAAVGWFAGDGFGIRSRTGRRRLAVAAAALSLSFPAGFFLLRLLPSPLTSGLYRVTAAGFGMAVHFALAAAAWGVIRLFLPRAFPAPFFRAAAVGLAGLTLLACGFGFFRAFHPQVKRLAVAIEGLPEAWQGRRVVQLSDVHLGVFHGEGFLERLVAQVNALAPDLVVITGDLFDGMARGAVSRFVPGLRRLRAAHGVFFVAGNHEAYAGLESCREAARAAGIRVLDHEAVEVEGVLLVGVAYPGVDDPAEIRNLPPAEGGKGKRAPRILLFHTPTDIRRDRFEDRRTATYWRPDTSFAWSRALGVDLQLSGHTHRGQIVPFHLATGWICHGLDHGLHRRPGFLLHVSSGVGTWGPPLRTAAAAEIVEITLEAPQPAGD
ncbi:MAG: metallophosphoesterase [Desulfobacterales bacterium]